MNYQIKTIANLPKVHLDKIEDVSDERQNGDGVWIYLKKEYFDPHFDPFWNCRQIHEETVSKCISRLKSSELLTPENSNERGQRNPS